MNLQESLGVSFMEGISYSLLRMVTAHPGLAVEQSGKCNAYSCAHELDTSLDQKSLRRLLLSSLELLMTTGVDSVRICA